MDLDTAITRLERIQIRLENVELFYTMHRDSWRTLAQVTVSQYLAAHMPPGTDPSRWTDVIEELTARVTAVLFEDSKTMGLVLFLSTAGIEPTGEGYFAVIDYDTILRWVHAGRSGDPLGKRILSAPGGMDAGKSDDAIAWRVFHALRVKSGSNIYRLREAIEAFAVESGVSKLDAWLMAILPVWFEVFTARASEDWREWVERMAGV